MQRRMRSGRRAHITRRVAGAHVSARAFGGPFELLGAQLPPADEPQELLTESPRRQTVYDRIHERAHVVDETCSCEQYIFVGNSVRMSNEIAWENSTVLQILCCQIAQISGKTGAFWIFTNRLQCCVYCFVHWIYSYFRITMELSDVL